MVTVSPRQNTLPRRSTVLLVESDEDNREMYAGCLRTWGFTVLTTDTTDEGLRCANNADVIVTDIDRKPFEAAMAGIYARVQSDPAAAELIERIRKVE